MSIREFSPIFASAQPRCDDYLGRPRYDAIAQAYGGMINLTGDPAGPPQQAKTYIGDYVIALTGWAATMMAFWEVKKSGRGQVIDLAQYEAVAQTNGITLPLFTGEGAVYGHTGNRPPGFQPYNTFDAATRGFISARSAGRFMIGCRGSLGWTRSNTAMTPTRRTPRRPIPRRAASSTGDCASIVGAHRARGRTEVNAAKIGCARVFNTRDQYEGAHYAQREITVPVLDRQSGVPIRVYGVVPKNSLTPGRIWRGSPSIGDDTTDILAHAGYI